MKTSLRWLAEYVDINGLSPKEISDGLRLSGTENVLESGNTFDGIVVGEIKEITKHPNADKLQIAIVDVGSSRAVIPTEAEESLLGKKEKGGSYCHPESSEGSKKDSSAKPQNDKCMLQIVCGAPNIKVGQKVPVALVGAKFEDFEIKKAKIRDVESSGMLCAEDELGLGKDHSGIMVLDDKAKIGQAFSEYLGGGEVVIDAELTPNRGDCLSMVGMAREVAATFERKFSMPRVPSAEVKSKKKINVEVLENALCPRYIAKVVEGIKIGPSPKWMQERLLAAGVRPISNVVDVTNYVMLELGQPLHAFDFSKISNAKNQIPKIIVRKAKDGETVVTLDGQTRKLTGDDLLICDSKKPVALAGVMGGLNSEVDEKTNTVVLEAAVFNPTSIRKTAQRLNLRSEASNRFEKGIPLTLPELAIERAAELLVSSSQTGSDPAEKGQTLPKAGENTDVLSTWKWIQHIGLPLSDIKKILGLKIPKEDALRILSSLGFEVSEFDFKKEARSHVGKPYIFGASYKTHGDMAFDCSYLTDYIYSQIGKFVGYTSLAQYEMGRPVSDEDLQPGDILFVKGHIDKSVTDHYFIPDGKSGYKRVDLKKPKEVGHNALYIGSGRVVHARHFAFDEKTKKWRKLPDGKVVEESVDEFIKNPEYLGARRYIEDPSEILAITVPWWRSDVKIKEDILEEIARINGYDKIPANLPSGKLPNIAKNKRIASLKNIREKLAHLGLTELITYSFISEKMLGLSASGNEHALKIDNPLSRDQEYMRQAIWPSLLEAAAKNQDYSEGFRIFETANTYNSQGNEIKEEEHLCLLSYSKNSVTNFFDLKGLLWSVFNEYDLLDRKLKESGFEFLVSGQGAKVYAGGKEIGFMGVVAPNVCQKIGLKGRAAIAEINLDAITEKYGKKLVYNPLPKYPRAKRDINVVFSKDVLVNDIEKEIGTASSQNLLGYTVVDIYEGKGLAEDQKSVTIRLTFGSSEKTLSEDEINEGLNSVIKKLAGRLSGVLRG